jgi:hypothetical protein
MADDDRLIIAIHPGDEPVELEALSKSFAALANIYERHYRQAGEGAPKLFVTRLETGSVIAEIAPYAEVFGQALSFASHSTTVADFTQRLVAGIRAFINPSERPPSALAPTREDTAQFREFLKPLIGRSAAKLGISRATFQASDGDRTVVAEYVFDEGEINKAAHNMARALEDHSTPPSTGSVPHQEVMLFFDSASRGPGRESGRTKDYGVVPEVSDRPLPVYFRSGIDGNLKDVMVRSDANPLLDVAYVVDLHVQMIAGEPKGYIVTHVHRSTPLSEEL